MRLQISAFGDDVVARDLIGLSARAADLTPAMDQILDGLLESNRKQFDSQGAHGSGGWAPLAASTVERKARLGLDSRILHATGALRESLTREGGSGQVAVARKDGLEFGSTLPYARIHQKGGGRVPKRPPVQPSEADRRDWVRIVQAYLIGSDPARSGGGGLLGGLR